MLSKVKRKKYIKKYKFLIPILIAIFIRLFLFNIIYVDGNSMNPTLEDHDLLFLTRVKSNLSMESYERGDIILFPSPNPKDDRLFLKRIIAIEGDCVKIKDGIIYLNNEILHENYISKDCFTRSLIYGEDYIIPKGKVYVVGDNRDSGGSYDSRIFGCIDINDIKGKIQYRIFPNFTNLK